MARLKDDEQAIRRELVDLFERTGNEHYRNAAEQLQEGSPFDELLALSKGKGRKGKRDRGALLQMARLILDGTAKGSRQAARIVAEDIKTQDEERNTEFESIVRRLKRKFDKNADTYIGFARGLKVLVEQQQWAQKIAARFVEK